MPARKMRVIDANILLRFFVNDIPEQADRCTELLKRVEANQEQVLLPDLVLADVVWTLEKFYRQPKRKIQALLLPILALRGLRSPSKLTARNALELYGQKNLDWTNAFIAAQMLAKGWYEIYSYDKDFSKVPKLRCFEP